MWHANKFIHFPTVKSHYDQGNGAFFFVYPRGKRNREKNASYKCYTIVKSNCSRNESSSSVAIMVVEKRATD